jgi:hypothetical protein
MKYNGTVNNEKISIKFDPFSTIDTTKQNDSDKNTALQIKRLTDALDHLKVSSGNSEPTGISYKIKKDTGRGPMQVTVEIHGNPQDLQKVINDLEVELKEPVLIRSESFDRLVAAGSLAKKGLTIGKETDQYSYLDSYVASQKAAPLVVKAAGDNKMLSASELDKLLADKNFGELVGNMPVIVSNHEQQFDGYDSISIGSTSLGKIILKSNGISFDPDMDNKVVPNNAKSATFFAKPKSSPDR